MTAAPAGECDLHSSTCRHVQDDPEHATCTCYYGDTAIATCEEQTATCDVIAVALGGCSCVGLEYYSHLVASCQVVGGADQAGAGSAPSVECQCKSGGQIQSVCQQTSLDCALMTSCCKFTA